MIDAAAGALGAWQAIVLGLVEGVTEYLPVSSTGHLILAERAVGLPNDDAAHTFTICVQAGAIVAVLGIYWSRVLSVLRGLLGRDARGLVLGGKLLLAFVPAALGGLLLQKQIKAHLFGLWPVVAAWFVGGLAILFIQKLRRAGTREGGTELDGLAWRQAFLIGAFQALALWPGTSRSLATIAGATLLGLSGAAAVEFSLLLGVITLLAATGYEGLQGGRAMLDQYGPSTVLLGFLVAFVAAWLSVRWLVGWLRGHGLAVFGWYRVLLAAAVALLIISGFLPGN